MDRLVERCMDGEGITVPTATFRNDLATYRAFVKIVHRAVGRPESVRVLGGAAMVAAVLAASALIGSDPSWLGAAAIWSLIWGLFAGFWSLHVWLSKRRQPLALDRQDMRGTVTVALLPHAMIFSGITGSYAIPWQDIERIDEHPGIALVVTKDHKRTFHAEPINLASLAPQDGTVQHFLQSAQARIGRAPPAPAAVEPRQDDLDEMYV